jgi:hypothetical protein
MLVRGNLLAQAARVMQLGFLTLENYTVDWQHGKV